MQTGTNLEQIKDYNQSVVLQIIRAGDGVSRVEVAQRTGLTAQTVSNIVGRLLALGLVVEVGKAKALVGKPRTTVRTNPGGGYALGVRIGRRETEVLLVDFDGRIVARTVDATPDGPAAVVRQVGRDVDRLVAASEATPEKVVGLGVACPGPLDHATGWVYAPPLFPGWDDVPLSDLLERETGFRVVIDNNARAAAVGERWAGAARHVDTFIFVYMGSGVAAGIFVDGEILRGRTSNAGAFGHITLDADGPPCRCGGRGCLDLYCAPGSIEAAVGEALGRGEPSALAEAFARDRRIDFDQIGQAALAGDEVARREVRRAARMLGHGVVSLVSIFDVGLVVLGGWGLKRLGGLYQDEVQAMLRTQGFPHDRWSVEVKLSATEDPAAVGAAALVLHAAFAPRLTGLGPGARAAVGRSGLKNKESAFS